MFLWLENCLLAHLNFTLLSHDMSIVLVTHHKGDKWVEGRPTLGTFQRDLVIEEFGYKGLQNGR